jgi:hypothetical protein
MRTQLGYKQKHHNLFVENSRKRDCLGILNKLNENVVKLSIANTLVHEQTKFIICYILQSRGCNYLTECTFKSSGRADIYNLTNNIIYEVGFTETENQFETKRNYYPENASLVFINAKLFKDKTLEEVYSELQKIID